MVQITITASKRIPLAPGLPLTLNFPEESTVQDLKTAISSKYPKFYDSRQKISIKGERSTLGDDAFLKDVEGAEVSVKDLGPQVSWRTVFLVEYAGPLVIHPLIYYLSNTIYRRNTQHSLLQKALCVMVMAHFLKRELETIFVHRFSHGTMPAFNIIKNSAHYHLLSGVALALAIYSPTYAADSPYIRGTIRDDPRFLLACAIVWLFAQLSNFKVHLILRNLRPEGTRKLAIPRGYGFSLVSVPNYFFECLAWATIAVMSGSWVAWLFLFVGGGQMALWAIKKHKNYKKVFGKEYPRRKVMIPFIF